jgi:hypothetical protein
VLGQTAYDWRPRPERKREQVMRLYIAAAISCLPGLAGAQSEDFKLVDAEQLLRERFGIRTDPFNYVEECLPLGGGGGMRARKVPCRYYYVISNIEIERILSVTAGKIDPNALPSFKEEQKFDIENCLSAEYKHSETVRYKSTDQKSFTYTENLTKVKEYKTSFEVNASLFDMVGGKQGAETTTTVTYSIGSTSGNVKDDEYEITKPIEITVPPKTTYTVHYSDTKRSVSIPVSLRVVLKADKMQEIRALAGNVHQATLVEKLNSPETEANRTFNVRGGLRVKGGDRLLSIRLTEKPCT